MRIIACVTMLAAIAACGEAESDEKVAPKASSLTPGQWELTSEVTAFETVDEGEARINTPVGTRATELVCVGAGRPPATLFAGEGYRCNFDNYYLRNGRLNVTLQCAREELSGSVPIAAAGTFEAESLEYERQLRTILSTDGDVELTARVTGRRVGECPPEAEGDNQTNAQEG
jgi:hypothetical protein